MRHPEGRCSPADVPSAMTFRNPKFGKGRRMLQFHADVAGADEREGKRSSNCGRKRPSTSPKATFNVCSRVALVMDLPGRHRTRGHTRRPPMGGEDQAPAKPRL